MQALAQLADVGAICGRASTRAKKAQSRISADSSFPNRLLHARSDTIRMWINYFSADPHWGSMFALGLGGLEALGSLLSSESGRNLVVAIGFAFQGYCYH